MKGRHWPYQRERQQVDSLFLLSPIGYYARLCTNDPAQETWCYNKAKKGECDASDDYQQRHCAKACDFCPKFRPGQSGLVEPGQFSKASNGPQKFIHLDAELPFDSLLKL